MSYLIFAVVCRLCAPQISGNPSNFPDPGLELQQILFLGTFLNDMTHRCSFWPVLLSFFSRLPLFHYTVCAVNARLSDKDDCHKD